MRQLILYIIFLMSMVFSGYGEVSAASDFFHHQDSHSFTQSADNTKNDRLTKLSSEKKDPLAKPYSEKKDWLAKPYSEKKDRLVKIDHKQNKQAAQLEDASVAAYRVCGSRPQRLLPSGNIHSHAGASRLLFHRIRVLSSLSSAVFGGYEPFRLESAPIHFDVASKYYVICLRHLRC